MNALELIRAVTTQAAAEPEALGERGMSSTAFNAKYVRFVAEAWADFKRSVLTQRTYVVLSKSKARLFSVGLQFTSTPSVAKSLIFSPFSYDTREEHVSAGYYAVQNLATAHNISVIHIQAGEVRKQFTVPAPRLDSKFLSDLMNNPEEGKRAFIGLRVNAVLTAILADIGRLRTEAGYTNTPSGPVYWYDLNNFHYRSSKFRPDEMAG